MKIIKEHENYHLVDSEQFVIGTTDKSNTKYKLSHKNCQAIFNGYDLDEMACVWHKNEYGFIPQLQVIKAYIAGFQKALEILGDKKFSEEDLFKFIKFRDDYFRQQNLSLEEFTISDKELFDNYQSLQQTEIEVEIEMKESKVVESHVWDGSNDGELTWVKQPKLDADGCLILKRK